MAILVALLTITAAGCASQKMVALRATPRSPFGDQLIFSGGGGLTPGNRTLQFLQVNDLAGALEGDPQTLLQKAQAVLEKEPGADTLYCIAELSFIQAKRVEASKPQLALDFYGAAVLNAYQYLFDDRYRATRNPYDPHFRGACDLYNTALEAALRLVRKDKTQSMLPDTNYVIQTAGGTWDITCKLREGNWRREDFGRFEFASDYEILGLKNHYHTYGLGVPLIAVRQKYADQPPVASYYPDALSFPVTAMLRPAPELSTVDPSSPRSVRRHAVLDLYDPLVTDDLVVSNVRVPLESDLTTPLAYFLRNPAFDVPTDGLLRPERLLAQVNGTRPLTGLWMVQPYEPGKIPVLMVHGIWSSPMTWMAAFNDLRSIPEIRDHYQFWFYLYPTAEPFWVSAARLRRDLATIRQTLDPAHREPALDQMVIVGHSMGGLVSRMQTIYSGNDFWNAVSSQPLEAVKASPEVREWLRECFYFEPNPSIRRVVTIATPHHGSTKSNQTTQWLAATAISLPTMIQQSQDALFRNNKGMFPENSLVRITNSVKALSPQTPIFPILLAGQPLRGVAYNNIIGQIPRRGLYSKSAPWDGLVTCESAHLDNVPEVVVEADHSTVHTHPKAILEVRRILLEHLDELRGFAPAPAPPIQTAENIQP